MPFHNLPDTSRVELVKAVSGMTLKIQRSASKCHWIVWLSAVVVLTSFTSAKIILNFQHPLLTGFEDDKVERQLRRADTGTSTGQQIRNFEDRAIEPPWIEAATNLFKQHVKDPIDDGQLLSSREFKEWVSAVKGNHEDGLSMAVKGHDGDQSPTVFDKIVAPLTIQYGETRVRSILNDPKGGFAIEHDGKSLAQAQLEYWEKNGATDNDIISKMLIPDEKGSNILTNPLLLGTWIDYAGRKLAGKEDPYDMLFELLKKQLDERQLAEYVVMASKNDRNVRLQSAALRYQDETLTSWSDKKNSVDEVFVLLQLDEDAEPLLNPALDMWAKYALLKGVKEPETWLFAKLQEIYPDETGLAISIILAKQKQKTILADAFQRKLFETWKMDGKTPQDIRMLLLHDSSAKRSLRRALWPAWKSYTNEWKKWKKLDKN